MLLAILGIRALQPLIPSNLPRFNAIAVNGGVLLFTLVISLVTTRFFALAPTLLAAERPTSRNLAGVWPGRKRRRGRNRLRSVLVVSEVALALLVGGRRLADSNLLARCAMQMRDFSRPMR